MEIQIAAVVAVAILIILAIASPGAEKRRQPVHTMVGTDHHSRHARRATYSAQVADRRAPRTLRVVGKHVRQVAPPAPARAVAAPLTPGEDGWGPLQLPKTAPMPQRLDWARQAAQPVQPVQYNQPEPAQHSQGERYADSVVASLLGSSSRAS